MNVPEKTPMNRERITFFVMKAREMATKGGISVQKP
jgi:hypothetical protein